MRRLREEVASLRDMVRRLERGAPSDRRQAGADGREGPADRAVSTMRRGDVVPFDGFTEERVRVPLVELLPDDELERLNRLLPWAAFVVDQRGRRFGNAWSSNKRNVPQPVPDPRIVDLDRRWPLETRTVLEIGCFEGIHTVALAQRAARVTAIDSRIENVVKTIVRCAMFGLHPSVVRWDVESPAPSILDGPWDVVHHVGVLYHLTDPVGHLHRISGLAREAIMLDGHVAPEGSADSEYRSGGRSYRFHRYREGGRDEPFAGMADHAKWLLLEDVKGVLSDCGFTTIDVASHHMERNGPRVLIYASR